MAGLVGVRAPATALMAAVILAGCGGHSAKHPTTASGRAMRQPAAAEQLPVVDRDAFVGIARASGELRAGTAAVAIGRAGRISGRGQMASARQMVAALRPRDGQLSRLKRQIDVALRAVLSAPSDPRTELGTAKAALAATTRVNDGLRRYANRHPSLALAIPD